MLVTNNHTSQATLSLRDRSSYYVPIERTDDLARVNHSRSGHQLAQSRIRIAPSRVPIDILAAQALDELSIQIGQMTGLPSKNELLAQPFGQILPLYQGTGQTTDVLKNELQRLGLTGTLIQASQRLNTSIDDENRHLLSREGLLIYAAYRAVAGFDVMDVDGIITNMLSALDGIRSYLNQELVDRVISHQNLRVQEEHYQMLKARMARTRISYAVGEVVPRVLEEFEKIQSDRGLSDEVLAYLTSGEVELPYGTDIPSLVDKMVSFLIDSGYKHDDTDRIGLQIDEKVSEARLSIETQFDTKLNDATTTLKNQINERVSELRSGMEDATTQLQAELTKELEEIKKLIDDKMRERIEEEDTESEEDTTGDDLEDIDGIGPSRVRALREAGITTFRQIAEMDEEELKEIIGHSANYSPRDIIDQAAARLD